MKKIFSISIILLVTLLLLPLSVLNLEQENTPVLPTVNQNKPSTSAENPNTIKVLMHETEKIEEMPVEDYLLGVVAGEMPALYEKEALKAQTVCAYTFMLWRQKANNDKDYDITDDYTTDQCFVPIETARERWGSHADEYTEKIKSAINEVKFQKLTYNGETILSVYHSLSSGKTESAKNVWGKDYPYLQAVASVDDVLATNYTSTVTIAPEQIASALSLTANEVIQNGFADITRTESGTVKTLKIGAKEFKGSEIRKALDLKSSNFEIANKDGSFTFTVYGYGHGVGMSQNGANCMAKQGFTYEEILKHYYTGCQIIRNS